MINEWYIWLVVCCHANSSEPFGIPWCVVTFNLFIDWCIIMASISSLIGKIIMFGILAFIGWWYHRYDPGSDTPHSKHKKRTAIMNLPGKCLELAITWKFQSSSVSVEGWTIIPLLATASGWCCCDLFYHKEPMSTSLGGLIQRGRWLSRSCQVSLVESPAVG